MQEIRDLLSLSIVLAFSVWHRSRGARLKILMIIKQYRLINYYLLIIRAG